MKYLLDTDHVSILQRGSGAEFDALAARIARNDPVDLAFSIVSFHEQVLGCHTYIVRARDPAGVVRGYTMLNRVIRDFAAATVLPFDTLAAVEFDRLVALRPRISTMDLRIAAIAVSRGLVLLTRNAGDFRRVAGLLMDDWTR